MRGFAFFSIRSTSETVRFPFHLDLLSDPLRVTEVRLMSTVFTALQTCHGNQEDEPRNNAVTLDDALQL